MSIFAHGVEENQLKTSLSDAQCLAISAYVKAYDWGGENCSVRSLGGVSDWMDKCWGMYWSKPQYSDFSGCSVAGQYSDLSGGSTMNFRKIINQHPECRWSVEESKKKISLHVIAEAKKILRQPQGKELVQ